MCARQGAHKKAGKSWVVDIDLEKFFDRVNQDLLMARVARKVKDKRVLKLIRRFLNVGDCRSAAMPTTRQASLAANLHR